MKHKYELLAPVGDFPMLVTAINAGADAVYFGLQDFTMRVGSKNFKLKDLPEMRKICGKNIKMYLTLNTIVYDAEIKKLEKIIQGSKKYIDAVICWDLSVIQLCKKHKVPFHISTQASISNSEALNFYKKLGAERVVLARELNLKQIKKMSKIIPIECFAHGALCVSISGRCFTSQFLFNRSANRGVCIQPCRRSYQIRDEEGNELKLENNKVMSAKDLCTLPFIEKMKKAGIVSFKIEGRNRDPRYVDIVIKTYRKALDKKLTKKELEESLKELEKVYHRDFSSGFYLKSPTSDDFAKVEHSAATEKKHFVGEITNYYSKIGVATIKLVSELNVGDDIIIIGKTTGLEKAKVNSMEIKKKSATQGKKGDEIGIKLPLVRKHNDVYVIKKK